MVQSAAHRPKVNPFMRLRLKAKPSDVAAVSLFLLSAIILSWLGIHQQDSFHTVALDLAKFDQAIWNTAHGRPFQITLGEQLVLDSHFSPALALFAPAYWLWPDIRLLAVLQAVLMAGAGLVIYWFLRLEHPWLGLAVFASYLMHPAFHQVYLSGFRRETLAILTTSLVLFFMLKRRYGRMVVWLVITVLCKEDMAFTCIGVGLYVALAQRSPKLGLPLAAIGLAYVVLIPYKIMPALSGGSSYGLANAYFGYLGHSLGEMIHSVITQPGLWLHYLLQPERLRALALFLLPSVGLFALAPEVAAFLVPFLGYMLLSSSDALGQLRDWYPSVLLVFLFWAVALGVQRLPRTWQKWAAGLLLVAGLGSWTLTSQLWPGPNFHPDIFQVTAHDRQVDRVLQGVPTQAAVAAQDALVPHLAHRQGIYLYPWMPPKAQLDYFAFDRDSPSTYPISNDEYRTLFYNYLATPGYPILAQVDNFYLFGRAGAWRPAVPRQDTWNQSVTLTGYSVTLSAPGSAFQETGTNDPAAVTARVELFWRAEQATGQNWSGFAQLLDSQQQVIAQSEGWLADGFRPTSVLRPGEAVRDLRYLSWTRSNPSEPLSLRIGLHDSQSSQPLALADGQSYIVVPLGQ